MAELSPKFVSQKISKIRWRPVQKQSLKAAEYFVTGSWDDDKNKVCFWRLDQSPVKEEIALADNQYGELEPQKVCEIDQDGDVTDLCYVSMENLVSTSSTGSVYLYRQNSQGIDMINSWDRLHEFNGQSTPCTCVSSRGDDMIVTGGEDGRLAILNITQTKPVRIIEKADSCTVNSVTFLTQSEILTVNSFGQLKIFDIRVDTEEPTKILSVNEDNTPLHCVDKHPGQPHIVATGGQDGMLTIWDVRKDRFPMTLLEAHSAAMWEVKFHPSNPDHLFTCSEDGSLWHWDGSAMGITQGSLLTGHGLGGSQFSSTHHQTDKISSESSPWISIESSRHKLEINSLLPNKSLPVNSLDIQNYTLLCGTDSETIYTVPLPNLR
ncbi:nucleoporin Nup43 [Patella vulgata]|uniref:nucleoporin Nup43 n=1 Tax=Patella vulgata TaxID=6465 RepID=UPI00217FEF2B|nr:nucleoporin Nup43 [Patella vulgata]